MVYPDSRSDVDPVLVYGKADRDLPTERPWVMLNMVAAVDGHTAVGGKSGGLGSDADREVFAALRSIPDVVLAGSSTVAVENYGPAVLSRPLQGMRLGRGQTVIPAVGVISASLRLDFATRLFAEDAEVAGDAPPPRPIVITSGDADPGRLAVAREHADVIVSGSGSRVDLAAALAMLGERGIRIALCEGGPHINQSLLEAGLVDEVALTVAPTLAGGDAASICGDAAVDAPVDLRLRHVLEAEGNLFLRYDRGA